MPKSAHTLQTILFADIAGSTRLYEYLGDTQALALVSACLEKINDLALAGNGKVIKTLGDEVMCTFNTPDHAASSAIAMQETINSDQRFVKNQIRLRIGLHHGPTILEDGDCYGDAVNTAARMVALAKAGQVITNQTTLDLMSRERMDTARLVDQTQVKGKHQVFDVYELAWGQPEELTMVSRHLCDLIESNKKCMARMTVEFGGQTFEINQTQPMVSLGRDATNHVVVDDPKASRLHAHIEMRRDKLILVDRSTNGTYLLPNDGEMIVLRRDETVLSLMGHLALGRPVSISSPHIIKYQVE